MKKYPESIYLFKVNTMVPGPLCINILSKLCLIQFEKVKVVAEEFRIAFLISFGRKEFCQK